MYMSGPFLLEEYVLNVKKIGLLVAVLVSVLTFEKTVHAEGAGFSISPSYNSAQTDSSLGYFSMNSQSDVDYDVAVNVHNLDSNMVGSYQVQLVDATTTNSGAINYTPNGSPLFKTKLPFLTDLVSKKELIQHVTVAAGQVQTVHFTLHLPHKPIKGTLLGGVYVLKDSKDPLVHKGASTTNHFAMTLPIIINKDQQITPELTLQHVKLNSEGSTPGVEAQIVNHMPTLFGHIAMMSWITKVHQDNHLYERKVANYTMAPRSTLTHTIPTGKQALPAGKYTYHTTLTSGKRTYHLAKNFTVGAKEQKQINVATGHDKTTSNLYWYVIGGIGLIILIALLWGAYRLGRRQHE